MIKEALGPNPGFRTEPFYQADSGVPAGAEQATTDIPRLFIPEYESGELLRDKVVLLTGVGRGINNSFGPAIAREFGAQGAKLMLTATEGSREQGEALVNELQANGTEAFWLPANAKDPGAAGFLIEETIKQFGRIDILGANHGIRNDKSIDEITEEEIREIMEVNYYGTYRLIKEAAPHMARQENPRGGKIIVTTSISRDGYIGQLAYSSSKGAEHALVGSHAFELAAKRIQINEVAPGIAEGTEMTKELTEKQLARIRRDASMTASITPKDVAMAYLYFAADTTGVHRGEEIVLLHRNQVQPQPIAA